MHDLKRLYLEFVAAAQSRDLTTLLRLIHQHPELHDADGDHGCLPEILYHAYRDGLPAALEAGLSPDSGPVSCHQTLLQQAASHSDLDVIRLCLIHGANLERRNNEGETALGFAAAWGSLETVKLLVEAGAQINAVERSPDGFSTTALDAAALRHEIREYLLTQGARRYNDL